MIKQLHFQFDAKSGLPVYRQLMDQVQYYLASGTLRPGDQLPSIRDLAKRLAVNPTTIVKAYSELEHAGVIEMQRGKGAFISSKVRKMSGEECEEILRQSVKQLVVEASQIGAGAKTVVKLMREEFSKLNAQDAEEEPVQLKVVNGA